MRASFVAAIVLAAGGALLSAQAISRPQATFRSAINYVEVDVLVTDADGRFVGGLTAADFELIDAGMPQTIDSVREINIPIERTVDQPGAAGPAVVADVATNEGAAEGRIFVLVLDDLHTTPSRSNAVRQLARDFIATRMGPKDLAAVVQTGGNRDSAQEFTSNRGLLLAAVERFTGIGEGSAVLSALDDFQARASTETQRTMAVDRNRLERLRRARVLFDTIGALAADLEAVTGRRKALLLFSEGVDVEGGPAQPGTRPHETRRAMQDAMAAATRANVHVYAIDARGLIPGTIDADVRSIPFNADAEALGLTTEAIAEERRQATETLRTIAAETGGAAIVETNAFADGFARVQRENSTYYMLGFSSSAPLDGKFHALSVRVKRPGMVVRARAGYHAADSGTKRREASGAPMADMMTAALPTAGLPMSVAAPVFKTSRDAGTALITVEMPPGALRFAESDGVFSEDLHVVFQAIGANGKVAASDGHEFGMQLSPRSHQMIADRGFRMVARLRLKPGRYQLRVAAEAARTGRRGSVFADVIVPDFDSERLVWSGVSISSTEAEVVPTRPADSDTPKMVPVLPSAIRTFTTSDTLTAYAEAYDRSSDSSQPIDITASVRSAAGAVVHSASDTRATPDLTGERRGFAFRMSMPLRDLAPGAYVLSLTARSRAAGNPASVREIPFEVKAVGQ